VLSGGLHRLGVLRALPVPVFGQMALSASLRADVTAAGVCNRRMAGGQYYGQGFHWFTAGVRPGSEQGRAAEQEDAEPPRCGEWEESSAGKELGYGFLVAIGLGG